MHFVFSVSAVGFANIASQTIIMATCKECSVEWESVGTVAVAVAVLLLCCFCCAAVAVLLLLCCCWSVVFVVVSLCVRVTGEILGYGRKRSVAKAFAKDVFVHQERKFGDRRL